MAEKKQDTKIEREYVIPLREKSMVVPRYRKTPKAIKTIKEFLARHMKVENRDLKKVKLDKDLNQFIWARGIKKHPHKIKVKAVKEKEIVTAYLVDYPDVLKFKKLREEKMKKVALEGLESKKSMMQKMKETMQKPAEGQDDEKKKEEKAEKEKASIEETQQFQKDKAKQAKHQTEKPKKASKPVRVALQK